MQKLSTANVATLTWIQSHTAAQIADQLPPDYYPGVGKAAYIAALQRKKGIYKPTGMCPQTAPRPAWWSCPPSTRQCKACPSTSPRRPPTHSSRRRHR
jgi:hypothetical protein